MKKVILFLSGLLLFCGSADAVTHNLYKKGTGQAAFFLYDSAVIIKPEVDSPISFQYERNGQKLLLFVDGLRVCRDSLKNYSINDTPLKEENLDALTDLFDFPGSGSGEGTNDYNVLLNKPQIEGIPLVGNLPLSTWGIVPPVKSDWLVTDTANLAFIKNKPIIVPLQPATETTLGGVKIDPNDFSITDDGLLSVKESEKGDIVEIHNTAGHTEIVETELNEKLSFNNFTYQQGTAYSQIIELSDGQIDRLNGGSFAALKLLSNKAASSLQLLTVSGTTVTPYRQFINEPAGTVVSYYKTPLAYGDYIILQNAVANTTFGLTAYTYDYKYPTETDFSVFNSTGNTYTSITEKTDAGYQLEVTNNGNTFTTPDLSGGGAADGKLDKTDGFMRFGYLDIYGYHGAYVGEAGGDPSQDDWTGFLTFNDDIGLPAQTVMKAGNYALVLADNGSLVMNTAVGSTFQHITRSVNGQPTDENGNVTVPLGWDNITGKPFVSFDDADFDVEDGILYLRPDSGGFVSKQEFHDSVVKLKAADNAIIYAQVQKWAEWNNNYKDDTTAIWAAIGSGGGGSGYVPSVDPIPYSNPLKIDYGVMPYKDPTYRRLLLGSYAPDYYEPEMGIEGIMISKENDNYDTQREVLIKAGKGEGSNTKIILNKDMIQFYDNNSHLMEYDDDRLTIDGNQVITSDKLYTLRGLQWVNGTVGAGVKIDDTTIGFTPQGFLTSKNSPAIIQSIKDTAAQIRADFPSDYSLPTASETVLGGVKIDGSTITINDGVISATAGGDVTFYDLDTLHQHIRDTIIELNEGNVKLSGPAQNITGAKSLHTVDFPDATGKSMAYLNATKQLQFMPTPLPDTYFGTDVDGNITTTKTLPIANTERLGVVKGDNNSIFISSDGTISAVGDGGMAEVIHDATLTGKGIAGDTLKVAVPLLPATTDRLGGVKGDNETVTIEADGTIHAVGSGGTTNYNDLSNLPQISGVTLTGNKQLSDLGIVNNIQANWDGTGDDAILNKPTIPAAQVNSDWNAASGLAAIFNKPTIPAAQVNSDWDATTGLAEILHKPTLPDMNNYVTVGTYNSFVTNTYTPKVNTLTNDIDELQTDKINDAPTDGQIYARQNGQWVAIDITPIPNMPTYTFNFQLGTEADTRTDTVVNVSGDANTLQFVQTSNKTYQGDVTPLSVSIIDPPESWITLNTNSIQTVANPTYSVRSDVVSWKQAESNLVNVMEMIQAASTLPYNFTYTASGNDATITGVITNPTGSSTITNMVIPATIDGKNVTSTGASAFNGNTNILGTITFPNSLITIGNSAFFGCTGLTGTLNIPNSVITIESNAFYYCYGLTSINLGNSVTTIGNSAFQSCTGLTSINLGNSVTTIGTYAFFGCTGLTSVTIPNSVTTIGTQAFRGCSGLTSVILGTGITAIGTYAFRGCTGLISFKLTNPNSLPTVGDLIFLETPTASATLYVPNATIQALAQSTAPWIGFGSIVIGNEIPVTRKKTFIDKVRSWFVRNVINYDK